MKLILKSFASILTLHGQHILKCLFFRPQDLNLFFVRVKMLMQSASSFHQVVKLSFEMSSIVTATLVELTCIIVVLLAYGKLDSPLLTA